ncbi:uncharacterized protein LOC133728930 [Rosa rugosa]|uniref:uncharacterized protein LOC133728930 n=1 Tax=Rosa rugosa TaxID=74645 RepID=UPI002B40A4C6|nr:uncharacterized protein LOC133728930 [Rosa rugosa]
MEVNTTVAENHTDHKHHLSHSSSHHHHGSFPSKLAIIIIISIVFVMVVLAITLIILFLRRLKSAKTSGGDIDDEKGSLNNTSCRFIAQNSMNFNSSPDVKGGCLQGGNLGRSMRTSVAIMVFFFSATTPFGIALGMPI